MATPSPSPSPFPLMRLPRELRDQIYRLVLVAEKTIHPHLCGISPSGVVKFHDDNQEDDHGAIGRLLPITMVNKEIRAESSPIFYKYNSFHCGNDTPIYFDYLAHLGRLHLVHKAIFAVPFYRNRLDPIEQGTFAPKAIKTLLFALKRYGNGADFDWDTVTNESIKIDPIFVASGIEGIRIFLALRLLANAYSSSTTKEDTSKGAGSEFTHQLVIRVPSLDIFDLYPSLQWFRELGACFGIDIVFAAGGSVDWFARDHGFLFLWEYGVQGRVGTEEPLLPPPGNSGSGSSKGKGKGKVKGKSNSNGRGKGKGTGRGRGKGKKQNRRILNEDEILARALSIFPAEMERPLESTAYCYYRLKCPQGFFDREKCIIDWFDIRYRDDDSTSDSSDASDSSDD